MFPYSMSKDDANCLAPIILHGSLKALLKNEKSKIVTDQALLLCKGIVFAPEIQSLVVFG